MNYPEIIRELSAITAPSGFETPVIDRLDAIARDMGLQTTRSALGNLIVHRPGSGKKLALVAHADSRGFVVLDKGENGFCRIGELGHHALASCVGLPVRFADGTRGLLGRSDEAKDDCKITQLFVDVSGEQPQLGDVCVADLPVYEDGGRIVSPALSARAGCAVLLDVLEQADTDADLYAVFSVQHELGQRGAASALFDIQPDAVIVCECVPTSDTPGAQLKSTVKLGEGPVLAVKIGGGAADLALTQTLARAAEEPVQRAVYPAGKTDMLPIQIAGAGVRACAVGIPCRAYGQMGCACIADLEKTARLLLRAASTF